MKFSLPSDKIYGDDESGLGCWPTFVFASSGVSYFDSHGISANGSDSKRKGHEFGRLVSVFRTEAKNLLIVSEVL